MKIKFSIHGVMAIVNIKHKKIFIINKSPITDSIIKSIVENSNKIKYFIANNFQLIYEEMKI